MGVIHSHLTEALISKAGRWLWITPYLSLLFSAHRRISMAPMIFYLFPLYLFMVDSKLVHHACWGSAFMVFAMSSHGCRFDNQLLKVISQ